MKTDKEHYTTIIRNAESRFISYKKLLGGLFKDTKLYAPDDFEWMRTYLRDLKNDDERFLKMMIREWSEIKQSIGV